MTKNSDVLEPFEDGDQVDGVRSRHHRSIPLEIAQEYLSRHVAIPIRCSCGLRRVNKATQPFCRIRIVTRQCDRHKPFPPTTLTLVRPHRVPVNDMAMITFVESLATWDDVVVHAESILRRRREEFRLVIKQLTLRGWSLDRNEADDVDILRWEISETLHIFDKTTIDPLKTVHQTALTHGRAKIDEAAQNPSSGDRTTKAPTEREHVDGVRRTVERSAIFPADWWDHAVDIKIWNHHSPKFNSGLISGFYARNDSITGNI
ncbi:MAG: hypothetical protein R3E66_06630 [bacterium]